MSGYTFTPLKKSIFGAVVTLLVGWAVFLVASLATGTFSPYSPYEWPMSLGPSIMIGDSLFLPFFNGAFLYLLIEARQLKGLKLHSSNFIQWAIYLFILSLALNGYQHWQWVHDGTHGFMNITSARLTFGGWWHLGFSVVQTWIIFIFIRMWVLFYQVRERTVFKKSFRVWFIFGVFSLVSIVDTLVRYSLTEPMGWVSTVGLFIQGLVTVWFFFAISIVMYILDKRLKAQ